MKKKTIFIDITIIGTGYVGLFTGTYFAVKGNNVVCIDINAANVEQIQRSIILTYNLAWKKSLLKNIS